MNRNKKKNQLFQGSPGMGINLFNQALGNGTAIGAMSEGYEDEKNDFFPEYENWQVDLACDEIRKGYIDDRAFLEDYIFYAGYNDYKPSDYDSMSDEEVKDFVDYALWKMCSVLHKDEVYEILEDNFGFFESLEEAKQSTKSLPYGFVYDTPEWCEENDLEYDEYYFFEDGTPSAHKEYEWGRFPDEFYVLVNGQQCIGVSIETLEPGTGSDKHHKWYKGYEYDKCFDDLSKSQLLKEANKVFQALASLSIDERRDYLEQNEFEELCDFEWDSKYVKNVQESLNENYLTEADDDLELDVDDLNNSEDFSDDMDLSSDDLDTEGDEVEDDSYLDSYEDEEELTDDEPSNEKTLDDIEDQDETDVNELSKKSIVFPILIEGYDSEQNPISMDEEAEQQFAADYGDAVVKNIEDNKKFILSALDLYDMEVFYDSYDTNSHVKFIVTTDREVDSSSLMNVLKRYFNTDVDSKTTDEGEFTLTPILDNKFIRLVD